MNDALKAEIYRRSNELLRQLVQDEPEVREMLDKAREEQSNRNQLLPLTDDWMCGEA
jgi:hypothetical protein